MYLSPGTSLARFGGLLPLELPLPLTRKQGIVTRHTKYALRRASVLQVVNSVLTVATYEAGRAEGLVVGQHGHVHDFTIAYSTAVAAVRANQRSVAEYKHVCVRRELVLAARTPEAFDVPAMAPELIRTAFGHCTATLLAVRVAHPSNTPLSSGIQAKMLIDDLLVGLGPPNRRQLGQLLFCSPT